MSKMNSKDKEKTLQDRLKQFFRLNKGGSGNIKGRVDFSLTSQIQEEIARDKPVHHRVKVLRELSEAILQNHLEVHAIEKLWSLTEDLVREDVAKEHRHATFQFLGSLAQGQADKLGLMRVTFFGLISSPGLPEDIGPRLELLRALTDNGKDILYIEEKVAPFLLNWMPAVTGANKTHDLLSLLVNLVKYNAAFVEDNVICGLIQNTCFLCSWSQQEEVVLASLALLDVVVCYSQMPPDMLDTFISTLCITVNNTNFAQSCWKIMRKLLCTHLGHGALLNMCKLMQDPAYSSKPTLLRGAVFHVSMGMWGSSKVSSLHTTASAILPSYIEVLKTRHTIVTYEVVLCIRRLVTQCHNDLTDSAWDCVLTILEQSVSQVYHTTPLYQALANTLHEALTDIENLIEKGIYRGDVDRFFHIVESCSATRPEPSILRLINHLATFLHPTKDEWLNKIKYLLEHYFCQETRTTIRVKVIKVLSNVIHSYRALYEEELADRILAQMDGSVARIPDLEVRDATVHLLIELAIGRESKRCLDLLDLIEKFMNRPFEVYELTEGTTVLSGEMEAVDIKSATMGLIKIFKTKAYQLPSSHAIRAYRVLVNHLESHYKHPAVFEHCSSTRILIFKCFMQIRANALYHIGMPESLILGDDDLSRSENNPLKFSPYLAVDHRHGERPPAVQLLTNPPTSQHSNTPTSVHSATPSHVTPPTSQHSTPPTSQHTSTPTSTTVMSTMASQSTSPPQQQQSSSPSTAATSITASLPTPCVTHLSLQTACKAVIVCLKQDKDWNVVHLILKELPQVLQNKALVLSRHGNDIEILAHVLCVMVSEKSLNLPESLKHVPPKFPRSEFQSLVLIALASLASYPLEPVLQQRLVKCLQVGLASKCAGACVSALTLCILEMRDTMYKLLPEVLLNLSKISATVHVAIPVLEFLSTLTRLPKVFASFNVDQYMSVFAIALPYTNPFKYNHYTVSLAHHVIAVWFLKCRLQYRRDFVKFIIIGLKANVFMPFEEGQIKKPELINEDSSNRKRSSSLTEQGSKRREQLAQSRLEMKPVIDDDLLTFHTELTETCIDLMARHTFSSCAALPRRLGTAEWLLTGGMSMTWLLGHKLVTVTTSGCSQKAIRGGLCDRCITTCRLSPDKVVPSSPIVDTNAASDLELTPSRRRHKSAIQNSVAGDMAPLTPRTKDDLHMSSAVPAGAKPNESAAPEPQLQSSFNKGDRGIESTDRAMCTCWCQGWAEIHVRRPTGNMSWIMRLQNPQYLHASSPMGPDFPMADISTLFLPSFAGSDSLLRSSHPSPDHEVLKDPLAAQSSAAPATNPATPVNKNSPVQTSTPVSATQRPPTSQAVPVPGSSTEQLDSDEEDASDSEEGRRRNPVRRSNSSPEMSSRLKSPLLPPALHQSSLQTNNSSTGSIDHDVPPPSPGPDDKKLLPKLPPTRVSCEAIPEEMGGTTPPSDTLRVTPSLQSSVSYPGPPTTSSATSTAGTPTLTSKPVLVPTRSAPSTQPQPPPAAIDKRPERSSPQESRPDPSALPPLAFRDRGHTISVMSPVRKPDWGAIRRGAGPSSPRTKEQPPRSGINPSFVFLQLYHDQQLGAGGERPILVPQNDMVSLALKTMDYIPPYETHKLGVLYVGPGQAGNEPAILQNRSGSFRYTEFLQGLGTLIRLSDVDSQTTFLGGLEVNGDDGKFAYVWQDAMTQVIFHTATLMPTKETDPSCSNKKRHIGNDYVVIVFNESGEDYNIQCIKGQFNFACIVITPLGHGTNQVMVKAKEVLAKHLGTSETRVISDQSLPTLVRQLALHANLASMIVKNTSARYASNCLERLRHIKRLRSRVCASIETNSTEAAGSRSPPIGPNKRAQMDDFTEYTHYK